MEVNPVKSDEIPRLRALLEEAKALRNSENVFVSMAAERIGVILVDALYEVDDDMVDPWQHLDPGAQPIA
jgi:hypothetical protein